MPRVRRGAILGLDLSTRASAAICLPGGWKGDWLQMRELVVGLPLGKAATDHDRASRCETIAEQLVGFATDYHVSDCWIESYAYGMKTAAHTLGELGGVVRVELMRAGIRLHTANMSSARKLLLGGVPRGKGVAKQACLRAMVAAGMPLRGPKQVWLDLVDAFVAANLGLADREGFCFAQNPVR